MRGRRPPSLAGPVSVETLARRNTTHLFAHFRGSHLFTRPIDELREGFCCASSFDAWWPAGRVEQSIHQIAGRPRFLVLFSAILFENSRQHCSNSSRNRARMILSECDASSYKRRARPARRSSLRGSHPCRAGLGWDVVLPIAAGTSACNASELTIGFVSVPSRTRSPKRFGRAPSNRKDNVPRDSERSASMRDSSSAFKSSTSCATTRR